MLWQAFRINGLAVTQILLVAGVGYFLKRTNFLSDKGLDALSRLVIDVTLPLMIFAQLVTGFDIKAHGNWWIFPLISFAVTIFGLAVGGVFSVLIEGKCKKLQFVNLVSFQNSGFLPIALVAALLPRSQASVMFIYLFLFLIGFNLVMWPMAAYLFSCSRQSQVKVSTILNPPVVAALLGLVAVFLGAGRYIPGVVVQPMQLLGNCTVPLAMIVVGADLAQMKISRFDGRSMFFLAIAKLMMMPLIGLWFVSIVPLPPLAGLLIVMQCAVPPATSLSVIVRAGGHEDMLVSQGIFIGHVLSIITLPVFLSLYLSVAVLQ